MKIMCTKKEWIELEFCLGNDYSTETEYFYPKFFCTVQWSATSGDAEPYIMIEGEFED